MTTTRIDHHRRPARELGRHTTSTGREFVVYETPDAIDAVIASLWDSWEPIDPRKFEKASREAVGRAQRRADVRQFGIQISDGDYLVRLTRTQAVFESVHGSVTRFSRRTWRRIGGSRWEKRLDNDVVRLIENFANGRDTVDVVAERKGAATQDDQLALPEAKS